MPAAAPSNDAPLADVSRHPGWRQTEPADFRILIADDQEVMRTLLEKHLQAEGYRFESVTDGVEALESARRHPPDLILLDIMMPRLDGLSALAEMRQDPALACTYVILLTARSSLEELVRGLDTGADDYLTKPFEIAELMARVRAGVRLRAMQRLLEEQQQLVIRQEKLATVGHLASGIAHEFNNIMGSISGFAQLALNDDRFRERLATVALEQAKRAQKITSSLSSFAHGSGAGLRPSSIVALVDSALCLLRKQIAGQDVQLETRLPEDLPPVDLDSGPMQQALVHLLLNALQAVEPGGHIELRVQRRGDRITLEVDDDGPGIPADTQHRIFDPFFTTKGAIGNSEVPGTGLGLSFCQNIVHAHGGTLGVASSTLGGACLRLQLPVPATPKSPPSEESPTATSETPPATAATAPGSVVLVEDDASLQELVQEVLLDLPVTVFSRGAEAIEHCESTPPSVVILDLNLEGACRGDQVLEALSKLADPPPVVLTTGAPSLPPLPEGLTVQVLPKPYSVTELESALESLGVATFPTP